MAGERRCVWEHCLTGREVKLPNRRRAYIPQGKLSGYLLYVIEGTLETKTKRKVRIRTIWIIEEHQHNPRFVTAYSL